MFTIEVKKKEKDEKFSFEGLKMFHQECLGGEIEVNTYSFLIDDEQHEVYALTCNRCGKTIYLLVDSKLPSEIIKTAIDGQKRKSEGISARDWDEDYIGIDSTKRKIDIKIVRKS